jgi:hypothetical protein
VPHRANHHGKVIGHDVLITHSRSAGGLVKLDPQLGIDLAIIMVKLFKLKTSRIDVGTPWTMDHIVLHAMTSFMGCTVLSSLFNART